MVHVEIVQIVRCERRLWSVIGMAVRVVTVHVIALEWMVMIVVHSPTAYASSQTSTSTTIRLLVEGAPSLNAQILVLLHLLRQNVELSSRGRRGSVGDKHSRVPHSVHGRRWCLMVFVWRRQWDTLQARHGTIRIRFVASTRVPKQIGRLLDAQDHGQEFKEQFPYLQKGRTTKTNEKKQRKLRLF